MSTTPEPLPVEGDELAERIEALQRSIEWRRAALLAQTVRKLNAWRDRTRSDADQQITRLEAAQAAEQDELHMLEARQRLVADAPAGSRRRRGRERRGRQLDSARTGRRPGGRRDRATADGPVGHPR